MTDINTIVGSVIGFLHSSCAWMLVDLYILCLCIRILNKLQNKQKNNDTVKEIQKENQKINKRIKNIKRPINDLQICLEEINDKMSILTNRIEMLEESQESNDSNEEDTSCDEEEITSCIQMIQPIGCCHCRCRINNQEEEQEDEQEEEQEEEQDDEQEDGQEDEQEEEQEDEQEEEQEVLIITKPNSKVYRRRTNKKNQ